MLNDIDSCVTDPPYGLSFMGKAWDYDVPDVEIWTEVFKTLKPGAHLLSFFGSRTYHRGAIPIEDAGFEIRDQLMWLYGSGFPKSHNIGKAVDKLQGNSEYEGWGTALKPAHEPIVMARKPFKGTVANNVLEHGTGGINIDGCRVGDEQGRFPANVMHDGSEVVGDIFPETNPSKKTYKGLFVDFNVRGDKNHKENTNSLRGYEDNGGSASRYFYCAKTSKKDRDEQNTHPTVKPTELMRYLCRLVTPKGGVIVDPFMGSGSTGKAALAEGFGFVGIEMSQEYFDIACARIEAEHKKIQQRLI